jgi:Fic family protein
MFNAKFANVLFALLRPSPLFKRSVHRYGSALNLHHPKLIDEWDDSLDERVVQPLIAMAAMNLDFLCIHPFRDGNGRVSRLLLLLQCYRLG